MQMSTLAINENGLERRQLSGLALGCAAIMSLLGGALLTSMLVRWFGVIVASGAVIAIALALIWKLNRRDRTVDVALTMGLLGRSMDRATMHCFWSVCSLVVLVFAELA